MSDAAMNLPEPAESDSEEVVTALETAGIFQAKGDMVEAVRWLRRAAEYASEGGLDARAVSLARAAADLLDPATAESDEESSGVKEKLVEATPAPPSASRRPPAPSSAVRPTLEEAKDLEPRTSTPPPPPSSRAKSQVPMEARPSARPMSPTPSPLTTSDKSDGPAPRPSSPPRVSSPSVRPQPKAQSQSQAHPQTKTQPQAKAQAKVQPKPGAQRHAVRVAVLRPSSGDESGEYRCKPVADGDALPLGAEEAVLVFVHRSE